MVMALRMSAVGPCVSLPCAADIVPSARFSPAYLPSGVAPVNAPPGPYDVIEMPAGFIVPPKIVGNVTDVSAQNW